jgi:hypothetical protein
MNNYEYGWRRPDLPKKGWLLVGVTDQRADAKPGESTPFETCQMCGNEQIRFVHRMEHPASGEEIEVGCICAEHMCDDYSKAGPRALESRLKLRAERRARWLTREWRTSRKGNTFLNVEGWNLVIYRTRAGRWGYKFGVYFGPGTFDTEDLAKLALFDDFWAQTQSTEPLKQVP